MENILFTVDPCCGNLLLVSYKPQIKTISTRGFFPHDDLEKPDQTHFEDAFAKILGKPLFQAIHYTHKPLCIPYITLVAIETEKLPYLTLLALEPLLKSHISLM